MIIHLTGVLTSRNSYHLHSIYTYNLNPAGLALSPQWPLDLQQNSELPSCPSLHLLSLWPPRFSKRYHVRWSQVSAHMLISGKVTAFCTECGCASSEWPHLSDRYTTHRTGERPSNLRYICETPRIFSDWCSFRA